MGLDGGGEREVWMKECYAMLCLRGAGLFVTLSRERRERGIKALI